MKRTFRRNIVTSNKEDQAFIERVICGGKQVSCCKLKYSIGKYRTSAYPCREERLQGGDRLIPWQCQIIRVTHIHFTRSDASFFRVPHPL